MEDKKLSKLKEMMNLLNEGITRSDFENSFKKILEIVVSIKKQSSDALTLLERTYNALLTKIKSEHSSTLSDINEQVKDKLAQVKDGYTPVKGKDYFDGQNADESLIIESVKSQIEIPKIEDLEKDIPKLGEPIRDALELLNGEERLDKSAIKGLKEEVDELRRMILSVPKSSGGGVRKIKWIAETPSGTINGVNTVFYLTATADTSSMLLVLNGLAQRNGATFEFTLSNNNKKITYVTAPPAGSQHFCWYARF